MISTELIERLFERLVLHYGAVRMSAHWSGLDQVKAKAYWAAKLAGLSQGAILFALQHLPANPPTVDEFLAIARRCPQLLTNRLEHKLSKEDYQRSAGKLRAAWDKARGVEA